MVIPKGWEQVTLESICLPDGLIRGPFGGSLKKEIFLKKGYKIYEQKNAIYASIRIGTYYISPDKYRELNRFAVTSGDFIVSCSGTIGCIYELPMNSPKGVINQALLKITIDYSKIDKEFFRQYFISSIFQKTIIDDTQGGAMQNLVGMSKFKKTLFLIPQNISEQRRIAEVLSDTDAYISSLKKLIAKKEAVKQGVMQELLTGKKRLPGFRGEWVERKLGELLEYEQPQQYIVVNTKYFTQGIPVLTAGKSFILGYTSERAGVYNNPPIILFDDFTTESKLVDFKFKVKSSAIKILKNTGICNIRIVFELMQMIKFESKDHQRFWISIFSKIRVKIPPTLAEQTAIANILSDMDQEIEALKKKLKKVESIKQGMMQKLLTGDIRLLEGTEDIKEESLSKPKLPNKNLYVAEKVDSYKTNGRHSKGFDDAVMIAGIVNALYSPQYPLGRKKLQKCLYLLRRYQEQSTEEFKKKAAGPYADEIRYKGGEPIAIKSKYIISHKGTKGTIFSIGNNINQALEYINRWNMQADIEWVKKTLKFEKVDKLELWATVDMAICDLKSSKIPISVASIKNLIATNKEWSKKLEKPIFSDKNIAEAITILQTLFIKG
ncbi:restriction endonuclease subunit S [Treponema denticola]|uniref:restriction endonuclease subunit S n=1 Tax=Treponema denticola TaxID=158 RepID=UPI0020A5D9DA|nr:restriction endonuclease subunit S [Treponema denticola]UTD08533.1 restriction endonuclease subunit S [Treponema denticola]